MKPKPNEFTIEEIIILKEIAQDRIKFREIFLYDEKKEKIPRENYSDWATAMKKGGLK